MPLCYAINQDNDDENTGKKKKGNSRPQGWDGDEGRQKCTHNTANSIAGTEGPYDSTTVIETADCVFGQRRRYRAEEKQRKYKQQHTR